MRALTLSFSGRGPEDALLSFDNGDPPKRDESLLLPSMVKRAMAGMKGIIAALVLLYVAAVAQTPIDPLKRPEEAPGEYTWRITLGYTPAGREGLAVDPLGQPYAFTALSHEWRLGLTGTVHFGGGWKTGVEMFQITITTHELRRYSWGEERHARTERKMSYTLFQE